jgi:hypothetical protein
MCLLCNDWEVQHSTKSPAPARDLPLTHHYGRPRYRRQTSITNTRVGEVEAEPLGDSDYIEDIMIFRVKS